MRMNQTLSFSSSSVNSSLTRISSQFSSVMSGIRESQKLLICAFASRSVILIPALSNRADTGAEDRIFCRLKRSDSSDRDGSVDFAGAGAGAGAPPLAPPVDWCKEGGGAAGIVGTGMPGAHPSEKYCAFASGRSESTLARTGVETLIVL